MKTIGLIGGLSWVSTQDYYRLFNEMVNAKLGGANAAKVIMYSVNFEEIKTLTFANDWTGIRDLLCEIAAKLEEAGADCIVVGANTMHKVARDIQKAVSVPLIHIASETSLVVHKQGLQKVALLGTKYTMEADFFPAKLFENEVHVIIPNHADREFINDAIYNELGKNVFLPETKAAILAIINKLVNEGAQGVVLGCTEIP
jgi:aspartate racemase